MTWQMPALAVLVLVSSAGIDYSHACYVRALSAGSRCRAANWSVLQWLAASIGFVVAVKVSFWLLPFEALGLFLGTYVAVGVRNTSDLHACQSGTFFAST